MSFTICATYKVDASPYLRDTAPTETLYHTALLLLQSHPRHSTLLDFEEYRSDAYIHQRFSDYNAPEGRIFVHLVTTIRKQFMLDCIGDPSIIGTYISGKIAEGQIRFRKDTTLGAARHFIIELN